MTTLTLTLTTQDSSPAREWTQVNGESDTPEVRRSWYGQTSQELVGGLAHVVDELLSASEDARIATDAQAEFEQLSVEWKQETAHLSSPSMIAEHRAYQEIIGMGKGAIPLILRDLEGSHAQWFWALRSIARESPVRPEDRGDVHAMTIAWLDWGRDRRYI
jgi:hypothetical protein